MEPSDHDTETIRQLISPLGGVRSEPREPVHNPKALAFVKLAEDWLSQIGRGPFIGLDTRPLRQHVARAAALVEPDKDLSRQLRRIDKAAGDLHDLHLEPTGPEDWAKALDSQHSASLIGDLRFMLLRLRRMVATARGRTTADDTVVPFR